VEGLLIKMHNGGCRAHMRGRSFSYRVISQRYWWSFIQKDAVRFSIECPKCYLFSSLIKHTTRDLNPLTSPWPFAQWGMDIVVPLPVSLWNLKYLITETDYFIKWVKADPLTHTGGISSQGLAYREHWL